MDDKIRQLAKLLRESKNIVVFAGYEMAEDDGYITHDSDDAFYDFEMKYKNSFVDMYSARCYETRTAQFFEVFRNEMICEHEPGEGYKALKKLQDMGKLRSVINVDIYSIPKRAGCVNTIELNGSIYEEKCPKCKKWYPLSYIKESKRVPLCTECNVKIRPNVLLYGESLDNSIMTKAAYEIEAADVLLLLGINMGGTQAEDFIGYFKGSKFVVIADTLKVADKKADIAIAGRVKDILTQAVNEI